MRQSFKNKLQPLEKAVKKALGIRKERKGRILDSCVIRVKKSRDTFFLSRFFKRFV